jgi:hypothetical protein
MADPDISGMPDPSTIGLAPPDPTANMPDPRALYKQHHGYDAESDEEVANFMRDPDATPDVRKEKSGRYGASMLTGLPRAAAATALAVPAAVAGGAGALTGSVGAALDPEHASEHLETGRERLRNWSQGVYKLSDYVPATKAGAELSNNLLAVPGAAGHAVNEGIVRPVLGDNAAETVGDVTQDIGTVAPALGAPAFVRGAAKGAARVGRAVADAVKPEPIPAGTEYDDAGNVKPLNTAITPPVGKPVTGDSLRAAPNPIPPPDGTVAAGKAPQRAPAAEPQPVAEGSAAPGAPAAAAGAPSPGDRQRGSVRVFNSPKEEGPQEVPKPEQQSERAGHLDSLDALSGGGLPSRRQSAISGDYNATGRDWADKETGSPTMEKQIASENAALHSAADNIHQSIGSEFDDSVDPTTLGDRGRVTRGAIQGIEKHFEDATDGIYDAARASNQGRAIPKLQRVSDYLNDDSNFTNDAEIGLQRAAKQRMERLWTTGDPDRGAPPGSVNAAERLREFLNEKGKNPQAMGVAGDLKGHLDMDVAEHGGPGLFEAARAMRRHKYQMLEEPTGIKKLLTPGDSQGINHAIPEHKVMDYIAELPREQHEHVMNVLRAGAHLGDGELAESSAQAIREIQAHTVSRLHAAATDDGGKWNARSFYNAASRYGRNAASTFADRPDVVRNLKTINDAGNTLHMDRHYPGAVGQGEKATGLGRVVEAGGKIAASVAHEIPLAGRLVGRAIESGVEGASGKISEASREKAIASRLVGRNGERGSVQIMRGEDERNPRSEYNANRQIAGRRTLTPEQEDIISRLGGQPLGERLGGGKQRGAVGEPSQRDAVTHTKDDRIPTQVMHNYRTPTGGKLDAVESPELGFRQATSAKIPKDERGKGWGTRMLQRAVDDAHAANQTWRSDKQVSDGQAGAYGNLAKLGYDVKMKDNDHRGGAYNAVGDHVFEVKPRKINIPSGQRGSVKVMNGKEEYEANPDLEKLVHDSAPAHRVDPNGPTTWEELQARKGEKVMPVNPTASENSIYKDQKTNIAFRAWHDKLHQDLNAGFDHDGELKVAQEHLRQAKAAGLSEESQRALWADTWETFKHHEDNGEFPSKPREFVAEQMKNKFPGDKSEDGKGSMLNVGLHQGQEGQKGFRKMSKQEAQAAVESTGAKVTKSSVLTPEKHGVAEPTLVASTHRPLSEPEMQKVLSKTKQSAIPQRTDAGETSMHVAPGHEETAKNEGWDTFNPDYFREHDGRTMSETSSPRQIHPDSTVKNPERSAYPGVYDDPKEIMGRLPPKLEESPHMKEIFGKSRKDLHDDAIARGDVEPKTPIPGIAPKGKGSMHALRVTNEANAERLRNIISAYKEHDLSGYHGMVGWYEMDPMYQSIKKIVGDDKQAGEIYHKLNSYTSYASPMSSVDPEIRRGTAAATMAAEGKFDKFASHGGKPNTSAPKDLKAKNFELGNEGHAMHSTAHAPAMTRFNETGAEAKAVKTGTYRRSSDAPSREGSEYQNTNPVGDSHWSRGVGLADVRGSQVFNGSAEGPEMKVLGRWFHDNVARHPDIDLPSTSAQAVQWGALSKETGVDSPIGAPKLEIWANQIAAAAKREGIAPKAMWERIVKRLAK